MSDLVGNNKLLVFSCKVPNLFCSIANALKEENADSGETAKQTATVSSRGFTSTNNTSFTSTKLKQNLSKHNISGGKNSAMKGAKNQKPKSRPSGKMFKESPHKNDKMKQKTDKIKQKNEKTPEKEGESLLPEVTVVRSFNTAEAEMEPSTHSPKKYVLFVGNLPYSVTKEQVEEHFKKTGSISGGDCSKTGGAL